MPPKKVLSVETLEPLIRTKGGNLAAVARSFKVTRQAVRQFILLHPELSEVVAEAKEILKDDAETALQKAIKGGEAWAVCFYLKTQARDRGYTETREVNDADIAVAIERELARLASEAATANAPAAPGDEQRPPLAAPL